MTDQEARAILANNDRRVKAAMKVFRDALADLIDQQERAQDVKDVDTSFERKNGVITIDKLTVAIHLMTAKLIFHVAPAHWKQLLAGQISSYATQIGGAAAATRAAKKIPGVGHFISLFSGVFSIPARLAWQHKAELDVRKACTEIRRDLNAIAPKQEKKKSRVRDVKTRKFRERFEKRFKKCKSK